MRGGEQLPLEVVCDGSGARQLLERCSVDKDGEAIGEPRSSVRVALAPELLKQFPIRIADQDSIFWMPLHRYRES